MQKFKLLFLLFTVAGYAVTSTPRLDAVEANNAKLTSKLEESQKALMQQELNNKSLESKINELKSELEKLKNTQDNYRIEKSSYDLKMQNNTDLINSQDKRISDINFYFAAWGILITFILLIVFWRSIKESKDVAKETAQEFIDKWIEDKATPHLEEKITEVLKTKDEEINGLIEGQIENRIEPEFSRVKALLKDIEADRDKAKTHTDKIFSYFEKIKKEDTFKSISKEELEKIEAKEISSLTSEEHYKLGISAVRDTKFNTALNEFENAIKLADKNSPKLSDLYFAKGFVLNELQEYDLAIDAYQKAVAINPKKDDAYNNMGIAYGNKGAYDLAIDAYQKAVAINPKKDEAYNNMGNAYANKGAYDLAIDAYQKAVAINPKKDEAYYNMGNAYYHLGAFDEVIKSYQQALTINPNQSGAYTNLFELQLTQNQPFDQILEEEYIKRFKEQKEYFIKYEMLKVFQNIVSGKPSNLKQWQERYRGVSMDWSFDELRTWIEAMEESEVKGRLMEALGVFEGRE